jgi:hypothetical protein
MEALPTNRLKRRCAAESVLEFVWDISAIAIKKAPWPEPERKQN